MKLFKLVLLLCFSFSFLFSEIKEVDKLFEKVDQSSNPEEKKQLIEKLKIKLAKKNIKKRQEADAIIKAKNKIPNKPYKDISLSK